MTSRNRYMWRMAKERKCLFRDDIVKPLYKTWFANPVLSLIKVTTFRFLLQVAAKHNSKWNILPAGSGAIRRQELYPIQFYISVTSLVPHTRQMTYTNFWLMKEINKYHKGNAIRKALFPKIRALKENVWIWM